ncbi:MAG: hypothetical protein ACRD2W_05730 [Acidimicrobiales bacterium]
MSHTHANLAPGLFRLPVTATLTGRRYRLSAAVAGVRHSLAAFAAGGQLGSADGRDRARQTGARC